jgi:hypothetical protein
LHPAIVTGLPIVSAPADREPNAWRCAPVMAARDDLIVTRRYRAPPLSDAGSPYRCGC